MCLILLSGTFFLVFMRVCGFFSVSKKDWCPITVIPVFKDICKAKRSFHLIFQAGNSAFLRLPLFFPVVGTVKVFGRYIDRLTKAQMGQFQTLKIQGGSAPFFRTAPAEWLGRFSAFPPSHTLPPNTLPAGKEQYLFSNKITLSSNSAKISSFQQPTRKDE